MCTEAARVQPIGSRRAAHDALIRLLHRLEPDSTPLREQAQRQVRRVAGLLILEASALENWQARPRML